MTALQASQQAGAAFAVLQSAYENRLDAARHAQQHGQRVVGYVGNTVPVELILAAGCMPLRIAPVAGDTALADRYVESFSDTDMRLTFQGYCEGDYDFLDLLLIPRSTESQHKLYLSLREARRIGATARGPELWLVDMLHTQRESSRAYGLARMGELLQRLAAVGGTMPDEAALRRAIAQTNATRSLLARLAQRRLAQAISGRDAVVATGACAFLSPQAVQQPLQRWLDADAHALCPGPRLALAGCPADHDALHALVERCGARIAHEEGDWGTHAAALPIADDERPLEAIFDHYHRHVPCVRRHPALPPGQWLVPGAIDGVLFYLPPPDDIYGWSFPAERAHAEHAGVPWALIREDARTPVTLAAQLGAFVARLTQQSATA